MMPRRGRRTLITIFTLLLVVNVVSALITGQPKAYTQVPYSPYFLEQVGRGNVQDAAHTPAP